MSANDASPQEKPPEPEPRNEVIGVRVTTAEKKAARLLAAALDTSESDLLRGRTVEQIVAEYDALRAKLQEVA